MKQVTLDFTHDARRAKVDGRADPAQCCQTCGLTRVKCSCGSDDDY